MISIRRNGSTSSATANQSSSSVSNEGTSAASRKSTIGSDLIITGNLVSTGELHIEGVVKGDIKGVNILVQETASIEGTLTGKDVIVRGSLVGSIKAEGVVLASTCRLEGDIFHQSLSIEEGAYFEGKSRRGGVSSVAESPRRMLLSFESQSD